MKSNSKKKYVFNQMLEVGIEMQTVAAWISFFVMRGIENIAMWSCLLVVEVIDWTESDSYADHVFEWWSGDIEGMRMKWSGGI